MRNACPRGGRPVGLTSLLSLLLAVCAALTPDAAHGDPSRGVGVSLGTIRVDDVLAKGGSYKLPSLGVINTGSEPGDYEVVVSYLDGQSGLRPAASWFRFQPQRFFLSASQVQDVAIDLTLPTGAGAGDYFALIEAHPVVSGEGVTIGAAAATQVSFNVKPSSWFEAQRLRASRYLDSAQPWPLVVLGSLLALVVFLGQRQLLRIDLRIQRRR